MLKEIFIHPPIFYTHCKVVWWLAPSPIPAVIGREAGYTWTGRQSITGPHRDKRDKQPHTLTPNDNLETPVNLTACLWTVGGSRRTRREPGENPHIHGENMQTPHRKNQPGFEPCCEATVLTTTPTCSPQSNPILWVPNQSSSHRASFKTVAELRKHWKFSLIQSPVLSVHEATVERKKTPF